MCPVWVMSPAFEYGKYGYSRHVESAFYCFLLADQKQRGWTTPGQLVLPGKGRDLRAQSLLLFCAGQEARGRLWIEKASWGWSRAVS